MTNVLRSQKTLATEHTVMVGTLLSIWGLKLSPTMDFNRWTMDVYNYANFAKKLV